MLNIEEKITQIIENTNQNIDWSDFREQFFNYDQVNLNVANLGSLSTAEIISKEIKNQIFVNPLKQYEIGRYYYDQSVKLAKRLFFTGNNFNLEISLSSSQISSIISRSFQKKLKVLTTTQEHEGGISAFQHMHDCYDVAVDDLLKEDTYSRIKPDIILFSHALYKTGEILPVQKIYQIAKKFLPNIIVILDAAQTLGVYPINMNACDIVFSSTHKWLHGPRGLGITCYKKNHEILKKVFYGSQIHEDKNLFSLSGGQDFLKYLELYFILKIYTVITLPKITERLIKLKSIFKDNMVSQNIELLDYDSCHNGILSIVSEPKVIYSKYLRIQEKGVHMKCFTKDGVFRISFPFYESKKRIENSAKIVGDIICGKN